MDMLLVLIPIIVIFVIFGVTKNLNDNSRLDLVSYKGVAETSISKDNGIVTIIYDGYPKTLIAASYKSNIDVGTTVLIVQYDEFRNIYLVEPYV